MWRLFPFGAAILDIELKSFNQIFPGTDLAFATTKYSRKVGYICPELPAFFYDYYRIMQSHMFILSSLINYHLKADAPGGVYIYMRDGPSQPP